MEDKRNILKADQPFDYKLLKGEKAQIFYSNKMIKILVGKEYSNLLRAIETNDAYQIQLYMAKVTRNFKHGNEKLAKNKYR